MKDMKDIYFVFENKQECKYYHKNVFFELENDVEFKKNYIIGNHIIGECNNQLFIRVSALTTEPLSLLKRIILYLRVRVWCPKTDIIVSKGTYFRFVSKKDFSIEGKDINNTYYFINDDEDYTDYILDIIKGKVENGN